MMVTPSVRRKAFRAALAIADTSQLKWSRENGIGHHHVGLVLKGKRNSKHLIHEVDAYIARVLMPFIEDYQKRKIA